MMLDNNQDVLHVRLIRASEYSEAVLTTDPGEYVENILTIFVRNRSIIFSILLTFNGRLFVSDD